MSLSTLLEPAIKYADEGFPVSDIIAFQWSGQEEKLGRLPSGQEMLLKGRAPKHGEIMRIPTLARTLQTIAEGGSKAFYNGDIAAKMAAFIQEQGGCMETDDLSSHTSGLGGTHIHRLPGGQVLGMSAQRPGSGSP